MKMSETRALYNKRARARLTRATPEIFPAPVLIHASGLRWTPSMPRSAADSYWRVHVLRADRLARALARISGAPEGWIWRVGPDEGLPGSFRQPPAPYREPKFARGPGFCCVCGQPVYRFGWHRDLWDAGPNRRAEWHAACVAAWRLWNAPSDHDRILRRAAAASLCADRRAALENSADRSPCSTVSGLAGAARHTLAGALVLLGRTEPAGHQSRRACREMRRGDQVSQPRPQGRNSRHRSRAMKQRN